MLVPATAESVERCKKLAGKGFQAEHLSKINAFRELHGGDPCTLRLPAFLPRTLMVEQLDPKVARRFAPRQVMQ